MDYFTVYEGKKPVVEYAVSAVADDGGVTVTDILGNVQHIPGHIVSVGDSGICLETKPL